MIVAIATLVCTENVNSLSKQRSTACLYEKQRIITLFLEKQDKSIFKKVAFQTNDPLSDVFPEVKELGYST